MTDSSTTAQIADAHTVLNVIEIIDAREQKAKAPKPTTQRMRNPTPHHTGDQYKGPKTTKKEHRIGGRVYTFSIDMTRAEAELTVREHKHGLDVAPNGERSTLIMSISDIIPVVKQERKPGSKKKWVRAKSKYSRRH